MPERPNCHQWLRVVSFCAFGSGRWNDVTPKSIATKLDQITQQVSTLFPGYQVWVYADDNLRPVLNTVHHEILRVLEPPPGVSNPREWRFYPLLNPCVDVFLSRDLDAPIIRRDADAVNDWLKTKYPCHIMRDHWFHTDVIQAGMFGFRKPRLYRDMFNRLLKVHFNREYNTSDPLHYKQDDQLALRNEVYVPFKHNCLAHDSYLCEVFRDTDGETRPFPSQRPDGIIVGFNGRIELKPCPPACRHNQSWITC